MPQTKKQEIVYTVMMVCVMVYGMVCYNIALDVGGMQNFIFAAASVSCPSWASLAFCWTRSWSAPRPCASPRLVHPRQGQAGVPGGRYLLSVRVMMCPLMSFFATLFFKDSHNANFFAMWVQTTAMNYPAAFLWQLCGAGPLVRFVFGKGLAL